MRVLHFWCPRVLSIKTLSTRYLGVSFFRGPAKWLRCGFWSPPKTTKNGVPAQSVSEGWGRSLGAIPSVRRQLRPGRVMVWGIWRVRACGFCRVPLLVGCCEGSQKEQTPVWALGYAFWRYGYQPLFLSRAFCTALQDWIVGNLGNAP